MTTAECEELPRVRAGRAVTDVQKEKLKARASSTIGSSYGEAKIQLLDRIEVF